MSAGPSFDALRAEFEQLMAPYIRSDWSVDKLPIDVRLRLDVLIYGQAYERRTTLPDGAVTRERIDPREMRLHVLGRTEEPEL